MIPVTPSAGSTSLPTTATFWMPGPAEISEDGFGSFRDTWLIKDVPVTEARAIMTAERRMAEVIDALSNDESDFERLAQVAEFGGIDDPAIELSRREREALEEVVSDPPELCGLELGVAGLAHALATVRILPAASCRSHPEQSWSDAPVVLFATTEFRARALEPIVEASGCTFAIDDYRRELLAVRGRTIMDTMTLADAVMASRTSFVRRRRSVDRQPQETPPRYSQESLF